MKRETADTMLRNGGMWLGQAREWVMWNVSNGDSVTWGSDDILHFQPTMRQMEEFAASVAAAAVNDERSRAALRAEDEGQRP